MAFVKVEDCSELLHLLEKDLPQSIHALQFLEAALSWQKKEPNYEALVLAPGGDISDGTFLLKASFKGWKRITGTLYSGSEEGADRLGQALDQESRTRRFLPMDQFLFSGVRPNVTAHLKRFAEETVGSNYGCNLDRMYWMPSDQAAALRPPASEVGADLRALTEEDAVLINEVWPHRHEGSQHLVKAQIKLNSGIGAYSKETGELLSWAIESFYGGLGLVQTVESAKRRGLAKAVVCSLTSKLGSRGRPVHLNIVQGNAPSKAFFEGLGFVPIYTAAWVMDYALWKPDSDRRRQHFEL